MARKTFTVAFRMGGRENVTWNKTSAVDTVAEAIQLKEGIEMGGRKALIFDTDQLNAVGLPVGWDANYEFCEATNRFRFLDVAN